MGAAASARGLLEIAEPFMTIPAPSASLSPPFFFFFFFFFGCFAPLARLMYDVIFSS